MLVILAFIILFHIISAILLFISTINNAWWFATMPGDYADLWYTCSNTTCGKMPTGATSAEGYLQAVQAAMILATILCCVDVFVFVLQLFRLKQGERFVFTAIIQLLSSLCVMIAASIYTAERESFQNTAIQDGNYGYSYVLAWVAFPMTFISGLMYLVLRKRK